LGKVYLVGGGPGDPSLITIKAIECLKEADVVIYDHLIDKELLDYAKLDALLIYAGKYSRGEVLSQEEINRLILKEARKGKIVVRLKGGDPYLFGRGSEESLYLYKNKIPFEVVPGISSALAVPNYAGIPLTHRGVSSMVTIITGHEDPKKKNSDINWEALARLKGTLVILMGMENLSQIVENLIYFGKDKDTEVAIIRWGTTSSQKVVKGRLKDIVNKAEREKFLPPCVIVIGKVVSFLKQLDWFTKKPLFGKRILIGRPKEEAEGIVKKLRSFGAETVEYPLIKITPLDDYNILDEKIKELSKYHWIIFTSKQGVKYFLKRLNFLEKDIRELKGIKIACIGPKTALEIKNYGILVDIVPEEFRAEGIIEAFREIDLKGKNILLPRAEEGRKILGEELRLRGALIDEIPCYRIEKEEGRKEEIKEMLKKGDLDIITFTSSKMVVNFHEEFKECSLDKVKIACIGPITASKALELGMKVDIVSKVYTTDALVEEIVKNYGGNY
jgi:uroporphyrinogen III methyltransferase/synthase